MTYSLIDVLVFLGSTFLLTLLLMELLDWSCILAAFDCPAPTTVTSAYLYGDACGPKSWKLAYPEARGREQSPINIITREAAVLAPSEPLMWCGYAEEPVSMSIANDGNRVILFGYWPVSNRPTFQGGPLRGVYDFRWAQFRWGPADDEGAEHSLDHVRHPLELQLVHAKRGVASAQDAAVRKVRDGFAIVSLFFQITSSDNPYLDHIVTNLWRISRPGACAQVAAFPLEWLFPSFERKYYTYSGSLTQPPCSEIVTWIVKPEPLAISSTQLAKFRMVCSMEGPILANSRPVQKLNDREVYYYA